MAETLLSKKLGEAIESDRDSEPTKKDLAALEAEVFMQFRKNLMNQELAMSLAAIVAPEDMLTFLDEMNAMSGRITEIAQRSLVKKDGAE